MAPCVFTTFVAKAVPLPCVYTAFVAKAVSLPLVSTAFVAKAVSPPCVSTAFCGQGSFSALCFHCFLWPRQCLCFVFPLLFVAKTAPLPCAHQVVAGAPSVPAGENWIWEASLPPLLEAAASKATVMNPTPAMRTRCGSSLLAIRCSTADTCSEPDTCTRCGGRTSGGGSGRAVVSAGYRAAVGVNLAPDGRCSPDTVKVDSVSEHYDRNDVVNCSR